MSNELGNELGNFNMAEPIDYKVLKKRICAWKHNILPSEVEEVLGGQCRVFRKEKGKVEGEHL